jgi:hypothetical protein
MAVERKNDEKTTEYNPIELNTIYLKDTYIQISLLLLIVVKIGGFIIYKKYYIFSYTPTSTPTSYRPKPTTPYPTTPTSTSYSPPDQIITPVQRG